MSKNAVVERNSAWRITYTDRQGKTQYVEASDLRMAAEVIKRVESGKFHKNIKMEEVEARVGLEEEMSK